jgi:Delta7-sterol 5-desaturase
MINLTKGGVFPFIWTFLALSLAIFIRYVVVAGIFHWLRSVHFSADSKRLLSQKKISNKQLAREISYSLSTALIFGIFGTIFIYYWQKGYTRFYMNIDQYHWGWIPVSILIILFLHETYYYWLHRLMHHPRLYRWLHRAHHESLITTAWTSFSFHPLESILQAVPILVALLIIPTYVGALILLFIIMTLSSMINHLGVELYPRFFSRFWLTRQLIGASHHHLHHIQFFTNYGLYFTFWDRWMHTESKEFSSLFDHKTTNE